MPDTRPITWVSLSQFEAMTPEQRARFNLGIDFTLPSTRQQNALDQRDIDEERAHGWAYPHL